MSRAKEVASESGEDIKIVSVTGDWEMLYINGVLKHEDHSISVSDLGRYVDGLDVEEEWRDVSVDAANPETYEELLKMEEVSENFEVDCEVGDDSAMFVVKGVDVRVDVSVFRVNPSGRRRYVDEFKGVNPEEGVVVEFKEDEEAEDLSVTFNRIHEFSR